MQYLKIGRPAEAAESLRSSLKIAPGAFTTRLNYGIALLEKGSYTDAEKELRRAKELNDASPTLHLYLGITLVKLQDYGEAEKALLRADLLGKGQLHLAHYYLGGIYWKKQEYRRAADELEKYLKLAPPSAETDRVRQTIKELRSRK